MSFRLGRVAGFAIDVDLSWFLILALVTYSLAAGYFPHFYPEFGIGTNWLVALVAALLLFASVLAHELMHSVVARRYGIDLEGITLFMFGGVAKTTAEPRTPQQELAIAAVGPATSLLIGALFWALGMLAIGAHAAHALIALLGYLSLINIALAAFNLLPGFPLDGGRVLRALLWWGTHSLERATRWASYSGQAIGYVLMLSGVFGVFGGSLLGGLWRIFIGWFLVGAAQASYEQVVMRRALSGVSVRRAMLPDIAPVGRSLTVQELVEEYLLATDIGAFTVVAADGTPEGIITVDDVRAVPREEWANTTVGAIAKPPQAEGTIQSTRDAWEALIRMSAGQPKRLLVVSDGHVEGVVTPESILRLMHRRMQLGV